MSEDEELLEAARTARERAYAPYSAYAVGAAVRCEDGSIVCGSNVENASFGLSICAERVAVYSAIASGRRRFVSLAVVGPAGSTSAPCGACRQVLAEFAPHARVTFATESASATMPLGELLPAAFELP
ncbi:MAG: cytidine deaminase [Vulcanimicrobiaceae bacterium]